MEDETLQKILDYFADEPKEQEPVKQPNMLRRYIFSFGVLFLAATSLVTGYNVLTQPNNPDNYSKKPAISRHAEKQTHEQNPTGQNGARERPDEFKLPEICIRYTAPEANRFLSEYNLSLLSPRHKAIQKAIQNLGPNQRIVFFTKNDPYNILTGDGIKRAIEQNELEYRITDPNLKQQTLHKFNPDDNGLNLDSIIVANAQKSVKPFDFDLNKFYASESRTYDLLVKRVNEMRADVVAGITSWQVDYNAIKYLGKDNYVFARFVEELTGTENYGLVCLIMTESTGISRDNKIGARGFCQLMKNGGYIDIALSLQINPETNQPNDPVTAAYFHKGLNRLIQNSEGSQKEYYSKFLKEPPSFKDMKDPGLNILTGGAYYKKCLNWANGDVDTARACYNLGPTAVLNGASFPEETRDYLAKNKEYEKLFAFLTVYGL